MAFAMDIAGDGFFGALPYQVFEALTEISVHANTTGAGGSTPSVAIFSGTNVERIVTPNGCIALTQGQQAFPGNSTYSPAFIAKETRT